MYILQPKDVVISKWATFFWLPQDLFENVFLVSKFLLQLNGIHLGFSMIFSDMYSLYCRWSTVWHKTFRKGCTSPTTSISPELLLFLALEACNSTQKTVRTSETERSFAEVYGIRAVTRLSLAPFNVWFYCAFYKTCFQSVHGNSTRVENTLIMFWKHSAIDSTRKILSTSTRRLIIRLINHKYFCHRISELVSLWI